VPQYSLILAMILTLLCVFTLIFFIHHVPETINVSRISSGLGTRLEQQICKIIDDTKAPENPDDWPRSDAKSRITSSISGYIQTCNVNRLEQLASQNAWHIEMHAAVGDFVTTATQVFSIWSEQALSDDEIVNVKDCFAIGTSRTENQNPSFMAEQLMEMATRALSPGINDPYTAMDCMNRVSAALTVASLHNGGLNPQQLERVKMPKLHFEKLFSVTFPLCRQYVKKDELARKHALSLLADLKDVARPQDVHLITQEITALSHPS